MKDQHQSEILKMSHMAMVLALVFFSAVIIALDIINGWEKWVIPVFAIAVIISILMHITRRPSARIRLYFYAGITMVELFYYCVHIDTIYDCTPVIAVFLIIFTMTYEWPLAWICIIVGYAGMIYHIIMPYAGRDRVPVEINAAGIVRTAWHFLIVAIAGLVVGKLMEVMARSDRVSERRIRELEDENSRASNFLANVSHEIRTPVNAILGLTGLCIEEEKNPEILDRLYSVAEAGERVGEQISDILDYSEIDMKEIAVNEEDYMISSVINDVVTELRPMLREEVELIINVDTALPSVLRSDVSKIKTIFRHLLSNGLKFTRAGGVYARITQIKQDYGINLFIEVSDTGIGMSPEELDNAAERFYQQNSSKDRAVRGLGLGLPIVIGFARALKGFMRINSEPGKGTKVSVSIPQKVVDPSPCMKLDGVEKLCIGSFFDLKMYENPQVREYYNDTLRDMVQKLNFTLHRVDTVEYLKKLLGNVKLTHLFVEDGVYIKNCSYIDSLAQEMLVCVVAEPNFEGYISPGISIVKKPFYCFAIAGVLNADVSVSTIEDERVTFPGVRALVVDDEPMNLTVAKGIFSRYGMDVSVAENGHESIVMCSENDYDVVFMDHMMPEMDGVEAMKRIRAQASRQHKEFPIVALTANALSTAREMFLAEGFDGFISKPIELVEFERVMKKVIPKNMIGHEKITPEPALPAEEKGYEAVSEASENDKYSGLRSLGMDVEKGLYYVQDDSDFYDSLLEQFVTNGPEKRAAIVAKYEAGDMTEYSVQVHSLKSSSRMIGANELSEAAEKLEKAAEAGDIDYVNAEHGAMLVQYDKLREDIAAAAGLSSPDAEEMVPPQKSAGGVIEFAPQAGSIKVMEFSPEGGED